MYLNLAVPDWEHRLRNGLSLVPKVDINPAEQARAIGIFERFRLPDVPGQPLFEVGCGQWFKEIVGPVLGATDPLTGARIVRGLFLLAPKKSSKTTYGAGLMMTAAILNKRPNAELLFTGPSHKVSELAYEAAIGMIDADDDWQRQENGQEGFLKKTFHARDHIKTIEHRNLGAKLVIKTFDMKIATGVKPIAVLVDELHIIARDKNASRVIRQLRGGMISNPEAFFAIITTQSDEKPVGVMETELKKARAIRDGTAVGNTLSVLYEFPKDIAESGMQGGTPLWYNSALWPMVTPNLNRSASIATLEEEFHEAKQGGLATIRIWASQHLNIEIGTGLHDTRWAGAEFWDKRKDPNITFEYILEHCELVVVGLDGGGLDDLFGLCVLGREATEIEEEVEETDAAGNKLKVRKKTKRWLAWCHAWCHEGVLERRQSIASILEGLKEKGDLTIVGDELEDISQIVSLIERVKNAGLLCCVAVDPAGLGEMVEALAEVGITQENKESGSNYVIGTSQGYAMMNSIKTSERKLANGTLVHADQPLMEWAVGNLKIEPTATAIRATKQSAGDAKIDPVMALFDAVMVMATTPTAGVSVFDVLGAESRQSSADGAPVGAESAQSNDIDYDILGNPLHPQWQEMRDRFELALIAQRPEGEEEL